MWCLVQRQYPACAGRGVIGHRKSDAAVRHCAGCIVYDCRSAISSQPASDLSYNSTQFGFNRLINQLVSPLSQQLRLCACNQFSTSKLNNVILSHVCVSSWLIDLFGDNNQPNTPLLFNSSNARLCYNSIMHYITTHTPEIFASAKYAV